MNSANGDLVSYFALFFLHNFWEDVLIDLLYELKDWLQGRLMSWHSKNLMGEIKNWISLVGSELED